MDIGCGCLTILFLIVVFLKAEVKQKVRKGPY